MAATLQIDLSAVDLDATCIDKAGIYRLLPHAHEFQLLDGVCLLDTKRRQIVAYADIRKDAWWVRGHVPGRSLLPGVLMLEMAAQTSAVLAKRTQPNDAFIGFGGISECKFRRSVAPGARLFILAIGRVFRRRQIVCDTQGVVDGHLVFEARITAMVLR